MSSADAKTYTLAELEKLLTLAGNEIAIFLYPTKRWMEWGDTRYGDAQVMSVDTADSKLSVSFSNGRLDMESLDYDAKMRFYVSKA